MFNIVVATDLERLPAEAQSIISGCLEELSFGGKVIIRKVPPFTKKLTPDLFENCGAIIVRPTDMPELTVDHFDKSQDRVYIYTVSVGQDHLEEEFENAKKFKILDTSPYSNARGVAAFNLVLAHTLFSRFGINANNVDRGQRFRGATAQTNLVGKTWLTVGCGEQVQRLIVLGALSGVRKFLFYNSEMEKGRFIDCFRYLRSIVGSTLQINEDALTATLTLPGPARSIQKSRTDPSWVVDQDSPRSTLDSLLGREDGRVVEFRGITTLEPHSQRADIVSIHVPHCKKGARANTKMVNKEFLGKLSGQPMLINTARGEIIDEDDVLNALKNGRLRGVAVDVLHKDVEGRADHTLSKLWSAAKLEPGAAKELNLIITPHISGAADNDIVPMWRSILDKIRAQVDA